MEYQITDRRSFMRVLGLKISDRVPDSKSIWKFRETLFQEEVIEVLFYRFSHAIHDKGIFLSRLAGIKLLTPAFLKYLVSAMPAMAIRTNGFTRAVAIIGLSNLTYNIMRCVQLKKHVHNPFLMG